MGDTYDEDEDRLMIDDVSLVDSSGLNISGTSANKKASSACARDDGVYNTDSKEEGEIDDEEDAGGNNNSVGSNAALAGAQQNSNSWSGVQQAHGYETLLNGGMKAMCNVEQHSDRTTRGSSHAQNSSAHPLPNALQSPTTSAATAGSMSFSSHPSTSQAGGGDATDGANKQADISHSTGHYKRAQEGTRQRAKIKKVKEEATEISTRQTLRSDGFSTDADGVVAGSSSTYMSGGRVGKKKKLNGDEGETKENTTDLMQGNTDGSGSSVQTEIANKRRKLNVRDKASCVSSRSIQTNDCDLDVKEGMSYCLDFTVIGKVSNHLLFVSNWNGRELYGILGDGRPPMEHTYMNRRQAANNNAAENGSETASNASHDRGTSTPSKQRTNSKRSNRSSSVCPVNGFPEKVTGKKGLCGSAGRPASASTSELPSVASESLQDEETSQSPVSWLSSGGGDPLYGIGANSIGSCSGLAQLKEASTSSMLACAIAGCGYRFDSQAQMTLHRRSHFDRMGHAAIFVENSGTQTTAADFALLTDKDDKAKKKENEVKSEAMDVSTDTPPDLLPASQTSQHSKPLLSQINIGPPDEKAVGANAAGENSTKTLSSTEQQSIKKMFEVVARPLDIGGTLSNLAAKKNVRNVVDSKPVSKGFESPLMVGDQGCSSSNALDAIQKMVADGAQSVGSVSNSAGVGLFNARQDGANRQDHMTSLNSSPAKGVAGGARKHGSPFSDLSDDAPVLAPEVNDKTSETCSVTVKASSSPTATRHLSPLRLPASGEKCSDAHANASDLASGELLCTSASSVTTSSTTTLSNSSVEIVTSAPTSSAPVEISKKTEAKQPPGITSVVNSFSPISAFPTLDGNSFSQGLRPPIGMPVGSAALQVGASTNAGMLAQQPYLMMPPFAVPTISSSPVTSTGKHKIHDLKTTSSGLPSTTKDNSPLVRMSPSMIASPGTRPPSVGSSVSGGQNVAMKSNQQQHNVNTNVSNQRPSSSAPFMMGQPIPVSQAQASADRNAANLNFLQQQQHQAMLFQYMNQMRSFPAGFPAMMTPPTSVAMAAQQAAAYEQLAMQGFGMYPQFPPK